MKNKIYTLIIVLFSIMEAYGQAPGWQWAKRGGGTDSEFGNKVCTDANGNSYVTGEFFSVVSNFGSYALYNADATGNSTDIFIAKYDASGNLLWVKRAGGTDADLVYGIGIDAAGNSYITGKFWSDSITFGSYILVQPSPNHSDLFIAKYNPSGIVVWAKKADGVEFSTGYGLATDPAGNSYITGSFNGDSITFDNITLYNAGGDDFYVAKYNSSGNVQWAKSAEGIYMDFGSGISVDGFGNCFVTGSFYSDTLTFDGISIYHSAAYYEDLFIVAYNASGNVQWVKSAWANTSVYNTGISTDFFGNTNITGSFIGSAVFFGSTVLANANSSTWDIYIAKYSATGNVLWAKRAGADSADWGGGIVTDINGNCYITGSYSSPSITFGSTVLTNIGGNCVTGCADIFIAKYDVSGNVLWATRAGGTSSDFANDIGIDGNANSYITGYYNSSSITFGSSVLNNAGISVSTSDFFIAKTSFTAGIEENSFPNTVNIFPNPGNGEMKITSADIIDEIEIRDVPGQVIYKARQSGKNVELKMGEGIYFVNVRSGKENEIRKVVEIKNNW